MGGDAGGEPEVLSCHVSCAGLERVVAAAVVGGGWSLYAVQVGLAEGVPRLTSSPVQRGVGVYEKRTIWD